MSSQSIKGSGYESEAQRLAHEEATHALDEQLGVIRGRVVQLEGALRGKDKEVERLQKAVDAAQVRVVDREILHQGDCKATYGSACPGESTNIRKGKTGKATKRVVAGGSTYFGRQPLQHSAVGAPQHG
jgi:hypothetical protein